MPDMHLSGESGVSIALAKYKRDAKRTGKWRSKQARRASLRQDN